MGLECTKVAQSSKQVHDIRRIDDMESQLRTIKDVATFNIIVKDLRLLNFSHTFHLIRIDISEDVSIEVSSNHFLKQDKTWISQNEFTARVKAPIYEMANKMVSISILDKFGKTLDQLKMKLYHLSTGPVKHDHLLKGLKSRLLFDFQIDQYLDVEVSLRDCRISWKNSSFQGDDSYFLNLIFSNYNHHMQATKMYEKHQKIKAFNLDKLSLRNSHLNDSIIRVKMVATRYEEDHVQYYIPYSKVVQQSSYKIVTGQGGVFESRQLTLNQPIIIKGEKVGEITFVIVLTKSKLYAQQMDCVILSQNGIVMTTASDFDQKERELDGTTMLNYLKKLRSGKNFGMSDFEFYKMMEEICVCLQEGKEFDITDDIFKTQEILLDFLLELGECIQEDSLVRNSYIWKILHLILHKKMMNLRYFGSIRSSQSKKKYALKFYDFLIGMLIRIIKYINNGINFKELEYIQQFVAYAFFRFTWCQTQIIQSLSRESDPNISQEKIAQIGASCRTRSPSKSYFYDWQTNVLTLIKRDEEFLKMMTQLQKVQMENPRWAVLLFDRDYQQLFYGLFSQLWDEAEVFLRNGSRIMWQYFPRYGDLLSIFFGAMNGSGIIDFSAEMTRCNMKLIKNEKLLNTFMMLIFPKTCLYETYSVLKCLDLINCYFLVILKSNKKMPHDFHYNYFYTGIRCILQSNHSFLLQQMLTILYKYYNIFSKEFKETLSHYITYKAFNQLFMHWSHQVRSIFHLLVIFKLSKYEIGQNPESVMKNGKISSHHEERENCEAILQNISILKEIKMEQRKEKKSSKLTYFQKMKIKLAQKNKLKPLNSCQILKVNSCQDFDNPLNVRRNTGDFIVSPLLIRRKWSVAVSFEEERPTPTEQQMTYLGMSLKEFNLAKTEKNPDSIVEARSKMLQINIDQ